MNTNLCNKLNINPNDYPVGSKLFLSRISDDHIEIAITNNKSEYLFREERKISNEQFKQLIHK